MHSKAFIPGCAILIMVFAILHHRPASSQPQEPVGLRSLILRG